MIGKYSIIIEKNMVHKIAVIVIHIYDYFCL